MRIAILSTTKLPKFLGDNHPDEDSLFAEDEVLRDAFAQRGAHADRVSWRPDGTDWRQYDLVLVRSTWDYIDDLPVFLARMEEIESAAGLLINPGATIRWNATKRYLTALDGLGLPVVPAVFSEPGDDIATACGALPEFGSGYVLKPIVGVGASGTRRVYDRDSLSAVLAAPTRQETCILQPFLASVAEEGEWSFVFGAGRFLYAALKTPKPGDFRVQVMYGARTLERTPVLADLAAATACYCALPVSAPFARIDMARMPDGRLALMEAELIEPQLFFFDVPRAAGLVADAAISLLP